MVRLTSRPVLHLTPGMVDTDFELPFYANVLRLAPDKVTLRTFEGEEGNVDRYVAEKNTVRVSEVNQFGRQLLLRRPVSVKAAGQVQYGQVVEVSGHNSSVQSEGRQFVAPRSDVTVVAPVVALLLEHIEFSNTEWSSEDIEAVEDSILNRVLGRGGVPGSNDISSIFDGLMNEESRPDATKVCRWVDPSTGEPTEFPLQHALNFAYYVDGGVTPVRDTIGGSFCRPPDVQRLVRPAGVSRGSIQGAQELFDPFTDDDESPHDESEQIRADSNTGTAQSIGSKRLHDVVVPEGVKHSHGKRQRHQVSLDKDAMILDKLSDHPDLLDRFLRIRTEAGTETEVQEHVEHGREDTSKVMKPYLRKKLVVTSKYAFVPLEDQERIHERITSEKHKGKSATVFCKSLVRSAHADFKALSGVCTRVYDIRFGSGGLSTRHFARLSRDERVSWLASGGSNFDNLSATAEFAAAVPASSIDDVIDATRGFLTYTREFCCKELVDLVESIVKFVEETLKQISWSPKELSSLVYWVNDVLEDFRDTVQTGDLHAVFQRCSTEDRLLRDMMFIKCIATGRHETGESVYATTTRRTAECGSAAAA